MIWTARRAQPSPVSRPRCNAPHASGAADLPPEQGSHVRSKWTSASRSCARVPTFTAFTVLEQHRPDFALSDNDVFATEQGLGNLANAGETQLAFETFVERQHWRPADPFFSKTVIWVHQPEHLYASGDVNQQNRDSSWPPGSAGTSSPRSRLRRWYPSRKRDARPPTRDQSECHGPVMG